MNILMIDIDTLRPDHMSCYGYPRKTTPNMDIVAGEGTRFENYYCSDAPCLPSRASLVSGKFGIRNGAVGHGGTAADMRLGGANREFSDEQYDNNLFHIFRKAGMHTASISTFPERHSSWWFNAGFNEMYNVGGRGMESGEEVLPVALDWIERNQNRDNWFLHVHFWDPHTPYRAPASFGNPFENEPLPTWITETQLAEHLKHTGPHSVHEMNMFDDQVNPKYFRYPGSISDMGGLRRIMDGYDCGILYADYLVGQILDSLRSHGIYDDCAIIITSDHGETMGEIGIYCEHGVADQATCRIPMIIKWPGTKQNCTDSALHYSLDLLPTLCDLLQVKPYEKWDGQSYSQTLTEGKEQGRSALVISQMAHVCQRSARFDHWLYIRTYHDGYHLFDREMLFDLEKDPYEQNDVKDQYPDICARGAKVILDWQDDAMLRSESPVDPLWTVMHENGPYHTWNVLPEYLKRLEQTGRAEGAEKLRQKYSALLQK